VLSGLLGTIVEKTTSVWFERWEPGAKIELYVRRQGADNFIYAGSIDTTTYLYFGINVDPPLERTDFIKARQCICGVWS